MAEVDEKPAVAEKPKRPVAVTLVAALAAAVAVYNVTQGVLALGDGDSLEGIFHFVQGAGVLVAAVGAFRLQPWGWALFMSLAVIGLTHQILRYLFFEDTDYPDMAVNTFIVLALSPLDVQIAFRLRHTQNVQLAGPTRNPIDSD
jgi:hypothetical protein